MRIDFATLAFGYTIKGSGGTPNWSTSLGQGAGYKINNDPMIDEILKGMIYTAVPLKYIKSKIGKGGREVAGDEPDSPYVLASMFSKVYVNDILIPDEKFLLIITKDTSPSHAGRLKLKYGPSITYKNGDITYSNNKTFKRIRERLSLSDDACWFVSDININNQDELILNLHIVDDKCGVEYPSIQAQHAAWDSISPFETDEQLITGDNILLYGVPGSGKSHTIKNNYCNNPNYMERVVFHPDYTYSDFVGQILPVINSDKESGEEKISYKFTPGPFTTILRNAINDETNAMYYLVIEEINRGNAPAIFGEIFQLLDRKNGESEYGITNFDIANEIYGDKYHEIKIPANLTILATMNTADQNVFTLDTAFKRRWSMRNIENSFEDCDFAEWSICGTSTSWESFVTTINEKILEFGKDNLSTEDARLGAFFIAKEELESERRFSEKVLMYLWNDAFKYNREKIFKSEYLSLEQLLHGFRDKKLDVFVPELKFNNTPVAEDTSSIEAGINKYLDGKNPDLVALYQSFSATLNNRVSGVIQYVPKSNEHITFKVNRAIAELYIQRNKLKVLTKVPDDSQFAIGEKVPDTHNWTLNYAITFTKESEIDAVVGAIINSNKLLVTGE